MFLHNKLKYTVHRRRSPCLCVYYLQYAWCYYQNNRKFLGFHLIHENFIPHLNNTLPLRTAQYHQYVFRLCKQQRGKLYLYEITSKFLQPNLASSISSCLHDSSEKKDISIKLDRCIYI